MSADTFFRHRPLDLNKTEIRLFQLVPSESSGSLAGTVSIFDFENCPKYDAVSYTWGEPFPARHILIEGQKFPLRENIWHFLNRLEKYPQAWLWIDQICIDQTTVNERNHQVSLMAQIYAKADAVAIWLGIEDDNSDRAIDALKSGIRWLWPRTSVETLFRRPYWGRLWILQEILMAKEIFVLCGDEDFHWLNLVDLFTPHHSSFERYWTYPLEINETVLTLIEEKVSFKAARQRLSYILETFSGLECEDVRDKVYGLLSLVRSSGLIPVDYSKTPTEVFFAAIHKIIEDEIFMDFDSHFDAGQQLRNRMMLDNVSDLDIAVSVKRERERVKNELALTDDELEQYILSWAKEKGHETVTKLLTEKGLQFHYI